MARQTIPDEHRIYEFTPDLEPATTVDPGDQLTFETLNSVEDAVRTEDDLVSEVPEEVNAATGPVAVDGAEPGDLLKVEIEDVRLREDIGRVLVMPGFGLQQDAAEVDAPRTRITEIGGDSLTFGDVTVPIDPMIGTIGVAPASESYSTLFPHDHGGNLDTTDMVAGTTAYFPVFRSGGLLAMGDSKAVMADGEVCGTGAEIGTEIDVTVDVVSDVTVEIERPLVETADRWKTLASADSAMEACELANRDACRLLSATHDIDFTDAYMLSSLVADLELSQVVDPLVTARCSIPKEYVDAPF